jgi:hypothetical protein
MSNTYTWDCKTVDVYPTHDGHSDVVYVVHWRLKFSFCLWHSQRKRRRH